MFFISIFIVFRVIGYIKSKYWSSEINLFQSSYISCFENFYINLIKKRLPTKKCNISHRSHMVNIKCFFCEKCIFMLKCRLRLQLKRMLMCLGIQQIDRSNVQTFRQKVFKSIFTHHSLFFPTFIQFIGFYVYCCWSAT